MKTPDFSGFAIHRKTLLTEWPGKVAVLLTTEKGKTTTKRMRFKNAQAALAWCETNGAAFLYLPAESVNQN